MPGRTKMIKMVDELYATMMVILKAISHHRKACPEVFSNPCIICSLRTGIFASKAHSGAPVVEPSPSTFGGMCHA